MKTLVAVASLVAVAAVTLWEADARIAPGPLHPVHAATAGLVGQAGCATCHAEPFASTCTTCHEAIGTQLRDGTGLHGSQPDRRGARCESCHQEHHGDTVALVDERAFSLAGVPERRAYEHAHVAGFALQGRHAQLDCSACHTRADVAVLPAGMERFLGLDMRCTTCHDDPHAAAFGDDCAACHGQETAFQAAPGFRHATFPLQGAHSRVACDTCHTPDSDRSVAALRTVSSPVPARGCISCHADPHGPGGTALPIATSTAPHDCARCHDTERFAAVQFGVNEHAARGVALRGAHTDAGCSGCHDRRSRTGAVPPPVDRLARCGDCHGSPHTERFLRDAGACAHCHDDGAATFRGASLTPAEHATTGFALAAPHATVDCTACHVAAGGSNFAAEHPGRYAGDCRACHGDPHGGQFLPRGDVREKLDADCLRCHAEDAFTPPRFDVTRHAATAFPLTGAHRAVACSLCHPRAADAEPRAFVGTPARCDACHRDPHGGAFDGPLLPRAVAGRTGCARCHDERSFRAVDPASFDHGDWTGRRLDGAHARADCASCHGRTADGRLGSAPTRCADCHDDPHGAQFASWRDDRFVAPADCARCHTERDWQASGFDHRRDARFDPGQPHASVACAACHRATPVAHGEPIVRYRPLPLDCRGCHGGDRRGGR
ncbi:MAG: hypothetical protein IPM29_12855 [Planctomycetes bacterium]|nr:hypothetical protein [Planctomycetota bacterium]